MGREEKRREDINKYRWRGMKGRNRSGDVASVAVRADTVLKRGEGLMGASQGDSAMDSES